MEETIENARLEGLTEGQIEAKRLMLEGNSTFRLSGQAGVGKSFLLGSYLKDARGTISITAPTHKGVSVANGDCTIHSFLGLRLVEKYGEHILERKGKPKISFGQTVVIDEWSMISTELLDYILEAQDMHRLKVIFVGDEGQLTPIGEASSPVGDLDCPSYSLTEIVRQAKGSNIISLASAIRGGDMNDLGRFIDNRTVFGGGGKELVEFFDGCSVEDFPPTLSFKNKVVNKANKWARDRVKDNPTEEYLVGEKVYIRSTDEKQVHSLEDIVRIDEVGEPFEYIKQGITLKFPLQVRNIRVSSYKGSEVLLIPVGAKGTWSVENNKDYLSWCARKQQGGSWKPFWGFSKSISEVKHIYALTVHRSQGSTFKNCIVNCKDISDQRMMYTAVTRASEQLFLYDY